MKSVFAFSTIYYKKLGILSISMSILMALSLTACERKPEAQITQKENVEKTAAPIEEQTFEFEITKITFEIPECKGQTCPDIKLAHIVSNYPELDAVIDRYLFGYVYGLVQGFDFDNPASTNTHNSTGQASDSLIEHVSASKEQGSEQAKNAQNKVETLSPEMIQLQKNINKFVALSEEVRSLGSPAQLNLYVQPKVLDQLGHVVTVVINASNFTGGAHGSSSQRYVNFDLETKKVLSIDQILESGQRREFNDLAYEQFKLWVKQTQPDTELKTYEQLWTFLISDNFHLGSNGLILQYDEYEIGPYAVGLPRLVIPYENLQGILKTQYLPEALQNIPINPEIKVSQEE